MVVAPLSMYSIIPAPLGLTLRSQCMLETAKSDLFLKNFYSVQNCWTCGSAAYMDCLSFPDTFTKPNQNW